MEDFHAAGGMGALLRELKPLLHLDTVDVEGRTLAERLDEPAGWVDRAVIRPFDDPISPVGGLVALSGSLAPDGAIFKRAAATPALFETEGRAVVFTGARRPQPAHRRSGSRRAAGRLPGAAEHRPARGRHAGGGLSADPEEAGAGRRQGHGAHLGRAHVRARRSARSCCTSRRRRRSAVRSRRCATATASACRSRTSGSTCWSSRRRSRGGSQDFQPPPAPARGYKALYRRTVTQAPEGCDFDFLAAEKQPSHGP